MLRSLAVLVRLVTLLFVGLAIPAMAQQSTQLRQVTPWDPVESLSLQSGASFALNPAFAPPPLSTSAWTFWGPAPIANGQRPGSGPVSGRLTGIAADPTDANTIYVAAAGGGVWKTSDGGTTWAPLTDGQATLSMGAIAIAPSNHLMLYAGTGEANNSGDSNFGRGILVSTDGGATWTLTTGPGGTFNTNRMTTSRIAVHPTDPNTAYAAMANFGVNGEFGASTGIYKTSNGGTTWTNVTAANGKNSANPWSDVVIDPTSPTTIYAAVGNLFGDASNGVYKSANGGVTWNLLPAFANGTSVGRISLAISASNSLVVYAAMQDPRNATFGQLVKMQRSDNGGGSITDLTAGTPNYMGLQGWYDTTLIVDPTNSAIVYAGGAAGTNSLLRSTNSGVSWTDISSGPLGGPHVDHHAATFDASGRYVDGNDGGLYRLDNPATITWTQLNGNLNTIQFQGLGLHPTNANVAIGGSQDNGTEKFNNDLTWTLVEGGDGGFAKWSSTPFTCSPVTCTGDGRAYHIAPVSSFGAGNFFRRSDNGGTSWFSKTTGFVNPNSFQFYAPFVVDPGNGNRLLTGGDRMYETTSAADIWTVISPPFPGSLTAIGLAASDGNTIYGGTTGSNLFVTSNHGASWTNHPLPVVGLISDIQVDPTTPPTAYATVAGFTAGGNVFKTVNGGANWTNISGNLPSLPVWSLQLDKTNNILYVAADDGVYSSSDGGTTWSRFGTGFPNAQVFQIQLNTTTNILGAATHGRGAWAISAKDIVPPNVLSYRVLFGTQSFTVPGGRTRLPWTTITGIQVTFSEPVTGNTSSLTGVPVTGFSGSGTSTLTWTFSPLTLATYNTKVLGTTANAVKDLAGNPLGGGVDFTQALNVLPGDRSDDGFVASNDMVLVNSGRSLPYNVLNDINGDSVVDINDVNLVRARIGTQLP